MTNILAVLTILTVTNWESVGTLTDKKGQQFDVVEGVRCTNWTATFEFEGRQIGFVLKSVRGDKCDEVKNPLPNAWFAMTNYQIPGLPWFTNVVMTNNLILLNGGGSTEILARTNQPTGNGITEWSYARTGRVQLSSNDVLNAVGDWPQIKHVEGTNIISLPTPHDLLPKIQLPTNQDLSNRAFMEIPSIKSIQFATNQ